MGPPEYSRFHNALGEYRSFMDPVSNWVLISGVELNRDFGLMVQSGKYPPQYLPDFLHEVAHHLCFHSNVGTAIALLYLRARRRAFFLSLDKNRDFDEWDILEDILRYETATRLMRPLAEGIALFCEFDAFPGSSRILSQVLKVACVSFSKPTEQLIDKAVSSLLWQHRLSEHYVERKANLLVQPFTGKEGGYLMGYLTVKNLQNALTVKKESLKLYDSDLFMQYLRDFFYNDFGFVAVLLDPHHELAPFSRESLDRLDSLQAISTYFQKRFAQLFEFTNDKALSHYEDAVLAGGQTFWEHRLGTDPDIWEKGHILAMQWLEDLWKETKNDDAYRAAFGKMDLISMYQRELICIGSFPAPVRVNEHGRFLAGEYSVGGKKFPVTAGPTLEGVLPAAGEGSIELFINPQKDYSVTAVSLDDKLVAVWSASDNFTESERDKVLIFKTSFQNFEETRRDGETVLSKFLDKPVADIFLKYYREQFDLVADEVYAGKGLLLVPDDKLSTCAQVMRNNGLYDVLACDFDLLMALAWLSLINGMTSSWQVAAEILKGNGFDPELILETLQKHLDPFGLPIIRSESNFFCLV